MNDPEGCARRIETLAKRAELHAFAQDLRSLAVDLRKPSGDTWVGTDLASSFPKDAVLARKGWERFEHVVGGVAGVLVFLPVAWTWISLHAASKAYKEIVGTPAAEGETFLSLWVQGFAGHLRWYEQLVPVTIVSASLIIFAAFLLLGQRMLVVGNATRQARLHADLLATLGAAQRILDSRRGEANNRLDERLQISAKRLQELHAQLEASAEQLTAGATAVAAAAQAAAAHLDPVLQALEATAASLEEVSAANRAAGEQLTETAARNQASLSTALSTLSAQQRDALRVLHEETRTTLSRVVNETVRAAGTAMASATSDLTTSVSAVSAGERAVAERLAAIAASNETLAGSVDKLGGSVGSLDTRLRQHDSALQGQVSEASNARDALERLIGRLDGDRPTVG